MGTKSPIQVAVLGGGCAAMTTAFELTRPEHRGRYAVTVYQMGWRLGGKGASGRGHSLRIEEHGLHLWLGFYENAFRLMRECYEELGRDRDDCPIATWEDAFVPAPAVAVAERMPNGTFEPWIGHFPAGRGLPGDALDKTNPFSVKSYLFQSTELLLELLRSAEKKEKREGPSRKTFGPERWIEAAEALLKYGQLASVASVFEATDILRTAMESVFPEPYRTDGVLLRLVDAIADVSKRQLEILVDGDEELKRIWQVVDLILAIMRGSIRFGLALDPRGFDAINDYDWREWLEQNGASPSSLDSGFVRGIYDLVFAFEGGNVERPSLAAGVALRGAMRMFFTYRGAFFWKMTAGMGDIVFAPLYEVLKRRGVRFEFFHKLTNISVSKQKNEPPFVSQLHFDVQASVKKGAAYEPLVDAEGVPSWPSAPDFAQLVDGDKLKRESRMFESPWDTRKAKTKKLEVSKDFDFVVFGLGIGALHQVGGELVQNVPKWRSMLEHVTTVPTQAFQLWLNEDMTSLGWKHPPVTLSGFVEPFDTWADMSHLISRERWKAPVKSIAYFCSPLGDVPDEIDGKNYAKEQLRVKGHAIQFLERDVRALWPKAVDKEDRFRWGLLAGSAKRGEARFDSQFWTANVNPSDRYTLSRPGSIQHRISPLELHIDNLTIAGDWTKTGLDSGCVESAVMSGLLAAHAISKTPRLEDIVGYDHP